MTPVLLILLSLSADKLDDPVQAGRKALSPWSSYPWYDATQDAVKPISVTPPTPRPPRTSGSSSDLSLRAIGWTVIGLLAVLALFLLLRVAQNRQLWLWNSADAEAEVLPPPQIEALPFVVPRPKGDLLDASRQAAATGDYGLAVLYLFSHQLIQLDRRRLIELERGKTNRQYVRELGGRSGLRRVLEQTMVAFEDVFFGHHAIDQARMDHCWQQHARFEEFLQAEAAG